MASNPLARRLRCCCYLHILRCCLRPLQLLPALLCTCSGPIPQQWRNTTRKDVATELPNFLSDINLSGNLLSGSLPEIIGGNGVIFNLRNLQLQRNRFTGRVSGA